MNPKGLLPDDHPQAMLVGRLWRPARAGLAAGPCIVQVTENGLYDLTRHFPTMADLLNHADAVQVIRHEGGGDPVCSLAEAASNSLCESTATGQPCFLSPVDLQPVKACGVTFHSSLVERMIEERAAGDREAALRIRAGLQAELGLDFDSVTPGGTQALELLAVLKARDLWSQYLEVGLGVDVEIFTKATPMASVGLGADIGVLPGSRWNNPEPEVVLLINAQERITGVSLGNDVNHRDIEGRSALLLGRAKDNNAACAIGPFIRLLDRAFTLDDVRRLYVKLEVTGADGFHLIDGDTMLNIRRDIDDIVRQCIGPCNSFPDGVALMLGAMASPAHDRDKPGEGFTHKPGDTVSISSAGLGTLVNRVRHTDEVRHREAGGISALMKNLCRRQLL